MDDDPDKQSRFAHTREQTAHARKLRRQVSKTERKLWPHLRSSSMGAPFRKQYPVAGYFADYCCVPLRLVVEVDGPTHSAACDAMRDHQIREAGFDVLRFSVEEIDTNLDGVVSTIYGQVQLALMELEAGQGGSGQR